MPSITENPPSNPLLQLVVPLLDSHLTAILSFLWRLGQSTFRERISPSDYQILEHTACLELLDPEGEKALYTKDERVRFLQNNIVSYTDMAWGKGNIFADYQCSPGVRVDTYNEGHRYRILISLRETKNRGDITEFHIKRTISEGFTKSVESFQHDISHPIGFVSLCIIFPQKRYPKSILLMEQNTTKTIPLGTKYQTILPDGRLQVEWKQHRPRLFESYIFRWHW
jgi:hypothetical protein